MRMYHGEYNTNAAREQTPIIAAMMKRARSAIGLEIVRIQFWTSMVHLSDREDNFRFYRLWQSVPTVETQPAIFAIRKQDSLAFADRERVPICAVEFH